AESLDRMLELAGVIECESKVLMGFGKIAPAQLDRSTEGCDCLFEPLLVIEHHAEFVVRVGEVVLLRDCGAEGFNCRTDILFDNESAPQFVMGFGEIAPTLLDGSPKSLRRIIQLPLAVENAPQIEIGARVAVALIYSRAISLDCAVQFRRGHEGVGKIKE